MEELNTALATLIEQATTGIDASVSFLQAELPDVIYQLLLWHGAKSGIFFVLGIIGLTYFLRMFIKGCKGVSRIGWDKNDAYIIAGVIGAVFSFRFINLTWLQIWIAPKVWLLEYAASLVK